MADVLRPAQVCWVTGGAIVFRLGVAAYLTMSSLMAVWAIPVWWRPAGTVIATVGALVTASSAQGPTVVLYRLWAVCWTALTILLIML